MKDESNTERVCNLNAEIYLTDSKLKDLIFFQNERRLIELSKSFLKSLEDIEHNYPQGFQFDFVKYRKICLDKMNDALRDMEELKNKINVQLI